MSVPADWFARVAQALTPAERDAVDTLVRLHPLLSEVAVDAVSDWRAVAGIVDAAPWDTRWADHEADERERLWQLAADRVGEEALFAMVRQATEAAARAIRAAARAAARAGGVEEPRVIAAASGGALMALQHDLLAREAGEAATHFFGPQFALYRAGRWPLGYHRGRYVIF